MVLRETWLFSATALRFGMLKKVKKKRTERMKKASVSSGDKGQRRDDNFKGFVNYSLTDKEKSQASEWFVGKDILALAEKQIVNGYKFSFSLDNRQGRCLCSVSSKEGVNAGFILTARASSILEALARVLFLHIVIFQTEAWGDKEQVDNDTW